MARATRSAAAIEVSARRGRNGSAWCHVHHVEQRARFGLAARAAARERPRQLGPIQQRIGIGPFLHRIAEALGGRRGPQRMPQLAERRDFALVGFLLAEGPEHGHQPVLWRAEFPGVRAPRLGQIDQRPRHGAQVAFALAEHARDAIHRGGWRRIRHEVRHQLRRDEARGGRVPAQIADDAFALTDAFVVVALAERSCGRRARGAGACMRTTSPRRRVRWPRSAPCAGVPSARRRGRRSGRRHSTRSAPLPAPARPAAHSRRPRPVCAVRAIRARSSR